MTRRKIMNEEKTIVVDIKLTGGLVVLSCILVIAGLLAFLLLTGDSVVAAGATSPALSSGMRLFYLSTSDVDGNEPLTACADGYHFASFWEIADPSNLAYNYTLGQNQSDSGEGPPSGSIGWVRTGYHSSDSSTEGTGNCEAWGSQSSSVYGSIAYLPSNWTAGWEDMGVWAVTSRQCHLSHAVWCIED
jgi:hypothetical protein